MVLVMGLNFQSNRAGALAGVFVLLVPVFLPGLFSPLGHASPSTFSVYLCLCSFSFSVLFA